MKPVTYILLLLVLGGTSCRDKCEGTQSEIQALMKDLYKKKITFPTEIEILKDSSVLRSNNVEIRPMKKFTIVHFFTADCDKCVNELLKIQSSLKKIGKESNVDFMFITSAPTKVYVLDAIKKTNFSYPIYYEKRYYSFKTINKLPLADELYNTMLLNSKNETILFGAFYDNNKAENLYLKAIKCDL